MKDDLSSLEHFPELNEENIKAAAKRREKYSLSRDLMMQENNEAISRRLAKAEESKRADLTKDIPENIDKTDE